MSRSNTLRDEGLAGRHQVKGDDSTPLVSIVVPCYNLGHLLRECINSILAQNYHRFEVLIMDNCSLDNTPNVVQSFQDVRVRYIHNNVNIGHLRNFNKGVMMSRGKYVWVVCGDDLLRSPDVLGRFVDVLERNADVGFVFCRAVMLQDAKEKGTPEWADCGDKNRIWNGRTFLARLIRGDCVVFSSVMARKEGYEKLSLFPLDMPHAADWYIWCVFALHYRVAYLSEPMVCFRVHAESLTTLFTRQDAGIFISDELTVLWRVSRLVEIARVPSLRRACRAAIAALAARALHSDSSTSTRYLSAADFEAILRRHVRDKKEEEDIRARVCISLGDQQYWSGEYGAAARSYWLGITLRPWRLKSWAKYLLLRMGSIGIRARQTFFATSMASRLPSQGSAT